jgi:peptide/nickel transport system ATP-binding protein
VSALEVDRLSIGHLDDPDRLIVEDVGFAVPGGGALAIVGESGSGKSLTARAIMGLLPPNLYATGSVRVLGEPVDADPGRTAPLRGRTLGYLMQDPFTMLHPLRRVGAQLADGLDRRCVSDRAALRDHIAERLDEVGLDATVAALYPHQLSGGMRQRVGIAAALLGDPKVLLADEPTTALDATTQRDVMRLILALRERRNLSLVLITHDLGLAFSACDDVLVMYAGNQVEQGPSPDIGSRPLHPYTAALVDAEPTISGRRAALGGIPGGVPDHAAVGDACSFADRCLHAVDECRSRRPPLREFTPTRRVACIRADELDLTRRAPLLAVEAPPPPDEEALIVVARMTHTFPGGHVPALDEVHLRVRQGEAVAVVGESGSGKTTLARSIVGLQRADDSSVWLDGTDISDWSALSATDRHRLRRTVQMVFQDPYSSLDPRRTVGSTLREALSAFGNPAGTTAEELLASVHLTASTARVKPRALSGGERQRVAIARALAAQPKLIVFDEAVSALDVSVQAQILDLINELRESTALALVLITHDLAVARQTTDTTYVLQSGSVVEHGPTASVLANPSTEYTKRLLASVPDATGRWLDTP